MVPEAVMSCYSDNRMLTAKTGRLGHGFVKIVTRSTLVEYRDLLDTEIYCMNTSNRSPTAYFSTPKKSLHLEDHEATQIKFWVAFNFISPKHKLSRANFQFIKA
uniref:Uncharacterized protein n=1 Tax=Glossina austeni TaxID=7395 RepID=A0A1A9UIS7_GLOAU